MSGRQLVIGTRGSDLALYQANFIKNILISEHGHDVALKIVKTTGDRIDYLSFDKMEGKGFFTKELEEALLSQEIDLAVHSLKDLMTTQPEGLRLGAVGFRADFREMLLISPDAHLDNGFLHVKDGCTVGTSSARRQCQILYHNPSLVIKDLRGNVPTRVNKLRQGEYDAIVLAAAGLDRLELDLSGLVAVRLDPDKFLPAPAQGILGIQIRGKDDEVLSIVSKLNDTLNGTQAALERGLLARYDSGCTLPLGVISNIVGTELRLKAVLGVRDRDSWRGLKHAESVGGDPEQLISEVFDRLQESEIVASSSNPG